MKTNKSKKYLTPKEAAAILNVSTESIRNWTKAGKLNAITTLGGHRRFLADEINRFTSRIVSQHSSNKKPRVLVVDDDLQFVKAIEEYFRTCLTDIPFEKAYDGFEAGHKVDIFKPTIIFLDFLMPNMNGVEVCKYLKRTDSTKYIKIYAMTGFASDAITHDFFEAGAEKVLAKPFEFNTFEQIINSCNFVSAS